MKKNPDFLVEIHTEELPPKTLRKLEENFFSSILSQLKDANIAFDKAQSRSFSTPRRLAVLIAALAPHTPDQIVERKGPAMNAAFNEKGEPTPACVGFAKSCGVTPKELFTIQSPQGEWVGFHQLVKGKAIIELLPEIITNSINALPIPKRMRWGSGEFSFVRPVHSIVMLYGSDIVPATILGCKSGNKTQGHRFYADEWLTITSPEDYEKTLEKKGRVIPDFKKREEAILDQMKTLGHVRLDMNLLEEVTGLVEWPTAMLGQFDKVFLNLPKEVLISSMQDHQRYFPITNEHGELLPYFITISNIDPKDQTTVIEGNERVLRARLSDAAFFYAEDQKIKLESRLEKLKHIVYQAKLGSLFEKASRLSELCAEIASRVNTNPAFAKRAGLLAKTDLTTHMVNEFPELQGVMGGYYAKHDGEHEDVAHAIAEQYMPVGANGTLPTTAVGKALALADRIDTLVGYFVINQIPTGDKDPFGLRRAAIAVLRMLVEANIDLDLAAVFDSAMKLYHIQIENPDWKKQLLNFMQERLRVYCIEKGFSPDVFAAVASLEITNPHDLYERVKAVQGFKALSEAESLSVANKRVSNILAKYDGVIENTNPNPDLFEEAAEKTLLLAIEHQEKHIAASSLDYDDTLKTLASLRDPVDQFFDHVMVMVEDKSKQENRLKLLKRLRRLFLQVADIALLQ